MMIPAILAVVALAAPQLNVPSPPPATTAVQPDDSQTRAQAERTQRSGDRPHTVGFGTQLAMSNRGVGAGTRLFFGDRIGLNLDAFWYRGNGVRYTTAGSQQGSTFGAFPSMIFMLTKPDQTRDVDVRPYIGGGVNYVSTSRRVTTAGVTTEQRFGGTGGQVFGGVEMTFRDADWLTISAEGVYYKLPVRSFSGSLVNVFYLDGFNYLLAIHFYLK